VKQEIKSFRDLEVYQKAIELTKTIYQEVSKFPKSERFVLTEQVLRSANSVGANIAEGFGRYHTKDLIRFLYNARGSLSETYHHFIMAKELKYLKEKDFNIIEEKINELAIKLNNLIRSLSLKNKSR